MGEQELEPVTADLPPRTPPPREAHLVWWLVAAAVVLSVGFVWWNNRAGARLPAAPAATAVPPISPRPTVQPTAPVEGQPGVPVSPLATAVELPSAQLLTPTIALPTVTPTIAQSAVATRTVSFGGKVTLRISLENTPFAGSGRPLDLPLPERVFTVGGTTSTVVDRWCMQAGIVSLVFNMSLALNPATEAVDVTGSLDLYDGFCDEPGVLRVSSPVKVEVPADTTAKLAQSLQTDTGLLGVPDLLDTNTGVFVELMISNTRPR